MSTIVLVPMPPETVDCEADIDGQELPQPGPLARFIGGEVALELF